MKRNILFLAVLVLVALPAAAAPAVFKGATIHAASRMTKSSSAISSKTPSTPVNVGMRIDRARIAAWLV